MLCNENINIESRNFVDDVNFSKNDPCIWVVYPAGASGDLLLSIVDKHYLRTGCEYYGISDTGKVHFYTTDYDVIDIELSKNNQINFNDQWFFDLAERLGQRNLNYSLLDQVIFGCHLYSKKDISYILETFSKAKIINIYPKDSKGLNLITFLNKYKNLNIIDRTLLENKDNQYCVSLVDDPRVLNVPFGFMFDDNSYKKYYNIILNFLNLPGQLICFDYVKFYLEKQHPEIKKLLVDYSKSL